MLLHSGKGGRGDEHGVGEGLSVDSGGSSLLLLSDHGLLLLLLMQLGRLLLGT